MNINKKVLDLPNLIDNTNPVQTEIGKKYYELSNHLGNVLSTISDRKIEHGYGSTVEYYTADIISATDYYPFGFAMDERNFSSSEYRFGFNGMEKDDEMKGSGNSYTTQFRQYDSRVARWLTIDPQYKNFPWQSPFVAFDNNPIYITDSRGDAGKAHWQEVIKTDYTYAGNNTHKITQTIYKTKVVVNNKNQRTVTQIKTTREITVKVSADSQGKMVFEESAEIKVESKSVVQERKKVSGSSTLDITPKYDWVDKKGSEIINPLGLDKKESFDQAGFQNKAEEASSQNTADADLFGYVAGLEYFITKNGINSNPYNVKIPQGNSKEVLDGALITTGFLLIFDKIAKSKGGKFAAVTSASMSGGFYLGNLIRSKKDHTGRSHNLETRSKQFETDDKTVDKETKP